MLKGGDEILTSSSMPFEVGNSCCESSMLMSYALDQIDSCLILLVG